MNGEDTVKMIRLMAQDDYLGIIGFMAEELAKQDLIKEKDKKDEEDNLLIKALNSKNNEDYLINTLDELAKLRSKYPKTDKELQEMGKELFPHITPPEGSSSDDKISFVGVSSIKELQFEDSFEDTLFFQAGGANFGERPKGLSVNWKEHPDKGEGILVCEDENVNKKQLLIDLEKRYPSDKDSYLEKVDGGFNGVDF